MAFHELTLSAVDRDTPEAVILRFETAPAGDWAFTPGQYLTLRATVGGQDIRRNYSIASAPGQPLAVGVKAVPGGAFSGFAQGLKPGDRLQVMPPEGRFRLGDEAEVLLIAAGSGITPMIAIASAVLAQGGRVTLVYGNRATGSIMFRGVLDALKDRYMDRFTLLHVLSREAVDVPLLNGRIDGAKIAALARAGAIDPAGAQGVFLCGPGGMIDDVAAVLPDLGVDPARLHFERFTVDGAPPRPASEAAQAAAAAGVAVEVVLDGTRRAFTLEDGDESLIEAAARQGVDLPWSCHGGMCSTCRCKVVEGAAEMAVNYALEPWEQTAGFTLACQARPTTERLVLDFDAA
ncbi:MAG: 2Fe-2S iron-sulfur cluster-binding protein [Rhodobacteraceae bacterium]|nr:2Fe-2S iron-sulfur cluster-binding protein [Paracoccaceae bacterium]